MWLFLGLWLLCSSAEATFTACLENEDGCLLAQMYPKNNVVAGDKVIDLNEIDDPSRSTEKFVPEIDLSRAEPWFADAYKALTKDMTVVDYSTVGKPGRGPYNSVLALFGKQSFPIATSSSGWVTIAGALHGDGRVLVVPRVEYTYEDNNESMTKLFVNAVAWMASGKAAPVVATHMGNKVLKLDSSLTGISPSQLQEKSVDVYVVSAHHNFNEADIKAIQNFVNLGGSMVMGGQAWYWGKNKQRDFYGNKIIAKFGILIGDYDWSRRASPVSPMPTEDYNLYYALESISNGSPSAIATKTLSSTAGFILNSLTASMPDMADIFKRGEEVWEKLDAIKSIRVYSSFAKTILPPMMLKDGTKISPASNVKQFPYEVPAESAPVDKTVEINAAYGGRPWQFVYSGAGNSLKVFTGFYAKAGERVTVTLPQSAVGKLHIQVGAHTDGLGRYSDEKLRKTRSPDIVLYYDVHSTTMTVTNPWGGLLYVLVPKGTDLGKIQVAFKNVHNAPYFILGQTTNEEWKDQIKNNKAPWAELEVPDEIILTVPTAEAAKIVDPTDLMNVYKGIMMKVNELAAREKRYRAERFTFDIQISAGWMHSGYPMMGFISALGYLLDANHLKTKGTWGLIHEIGHNQQWRSWILPGTTQTGCNWWSLFVNEELWNIKWAHGATGEKETAARIHDWVFKGKPREAWSVWLALDTYTILAKEFGWNSYARLIKKYYDLPDISNNDEKFDKWARYYSQEVNTNLCPYFEWFQFPLTDETKDICAKLPAWDKDPLKGYKHPTEHGTCDEGWIAYGDSCFFMSDEKATWFAAQEKCGEIKGASLASCLTEQEAFFLASQTSAATTYYIGISDLEKPGTFINLDGTQVPEKLPWKSGKPDNSNSEHCGCYYKGRIEDWYCKRERQYICKKGPSACKPKVNCPKDWVLWNNRCYYFAQGGKKYTEAVKACTDRDKRSSIVEIESKAEDTFLRHHAHDRRGMVYYWTNYWIGLVDKGKPGSFKWQSGKEVDYMGGWCEGEPDGDGDVYLKAWPTSANFCWGETDVWWMKAEEICEMPALTAGEEANNAADAP